MADIKLVEVYNAPVDVIWKALTDKDELKKWYFELDEFRPEVGFEFRFEGTGRTGEKYMHICVVTEVIPLKKMQYSWRYENWAGNSTVTFELEARGDRTQVTLIHDGVSSFTPDQPDFTQESFSEGWKSILRQNLSAYLGNR